jgi:uncharacterized protein
MQILRASDYKRMPWKNGGGLTREVFVKWRDASQTSWDWRISMADVVQSGSFSEFQGMDRSIAVLDGRGIKLNLPNGQIASLDQSTDPFAFAGEVDAMCELLAGPTTDLNVMTERQSHRHSLRKLHLAASTTIALGTGWNALIANTALAMQHGGKQIGLHRLDTVVDIGNSIEVTPVTKGDVFVLNVIEV